jgi:hypothetical protein
MILENLNIYYLYPKLVSHEESIDYFIKFNEYKHVVVADANTYADTK